MRSAGKLSRIPQHVVVAGHRVGNGKRGKSQFFAQVRAAEEITVAAFNRTPFRWAGGQELFFGARL